MLSSEHAHLYTEKESPKNRFLCAIPKLYTAFLDFTQCPTCQYAMAIDSVVVLWQQTYLH